MNFENYQDFLQWESISQDTIDFKKIYVDIADDLVAGLLLSQIIYWYLPGKNNKSKLRVKKDGQYWIAKQRTEWYDEVRISAKQFDRAAKILENKKIIIKDKFKFDGSPTVHIRLDFDVFLQLLNEQIYRQAQERIQEQAPQDNPATIGNTGFSPKGKMEIPQRSNSNFPKGQNGNLPKGKMEIPQRSNSLTENTTENTTKTTTKIKESVGTKGPDPSPKSINKNLEDYEKMPLEAKELTTLLIDRIRTNHDKQPLPNKEMDRKNKLLLKWVKEIDRLNRIGVPGGNEGFSWKEIEDLINFSQDDEFWQTNILSAAKLREQAVKLQGQMKRSNYQPPQNRQAQANLESQEKNYDVKSGNFIAGKNPNHNIIQKFLERILTMPYEQIEKEKSKSEIEFMTKGILKWIYGGRVTERIQKGELPPEYYDLIEQGVEDGILELKALDTIPKERRA